MRLTKFAFKNYFLFLILSILLSVFYTISAVFEMIVEIYNSQGFSYSYYKKEKQYFIDQGVLK